MRVLFGGREGEPGWICLAVEAFTYVGEGGGGGGGGIGKWTINVPEKFSQYAPKLTW